ncbi:MAG: membrane-associated phospholipid phosphatase [Bermanella sp.]|jgi:membrane-associated phospholipid phosphatase
MSEVLNWGADVIIWAQQFQQPIVRLPLIALTWLGGAGYLATLPLVVFALNQRTGLRLALLMAATLFLNSVLKDAFALPRPFETYPDIVSAGERGLSFPSGHAQLVVIFWGLLALEIRRRWFSATAILLIFLTGYSRIYLGVHYPTDVMAGWLLGSAGLWAWYRWRGELEHFLSNHGRLIQLCWLFAATTFMWACAGLFLHDPLLTGSIGFFLGCGLAAIIHPPGLDQPMAWWLRLARYLLGMLMVLLMIATLQKAAALLAWSTPLSSLLSMTLLGGWLLGGVPTILDSLTALAVNRRQAAGSGQK